MQSCKDLKNPTPEQVAAIQANIGIVLKLKAQLSSSASLQGALY